MSGQELMTDLEARVTIENAMGINYSDEQWNVVKDANRPASVVSCAGSGKTTVLIARLLYKELVEGIKPYRMLVITFNKKASLEIEERYQRAKRQIGVSSFLPSFHTFHAFFLRLLRSDDKYENYTVTNSNKYLYVLSDMVKTQHTLQSNIDFVKDILSTRSYGINNKKDYLTHNEYGELGRNVIEKYEELLLENSEMDFDDMLLLLYREMFEHNNQDIIQTFADSYDLVLIDEFQDISGIQYDIIEELTSTIGMDKLTVIGDEEQCIYEFRGSNPRYITQFGNMIPSAKTHLLTVNYRCPQEILAFVAPSIYRNEKRVEKALRSSNTGGEVSFLGVKEDEPLVQSIIDDYRENKEIAILVRNNHQKTVISDRLIRRGISVDMGSSNYTVKNNQVFKRLTNFIDLVRESDNSGFIKYHWMFGVQRYRNTEIKARYRGTDEFWVEDVLEQDMWDVPPAKKRLIQGMLREEKADKLYELAMKFYRSSFLSGARKGYYNMDTVDDYYEYIINGIAKDQDYLEFREKIDYYQKFVDRNIGNKKAVQVNTMHTVKGLEYDTVIVYDPSDSNMFPEYRYIWERSARDHSLTVNEFKKGILNYDENYLATLASYATENNSERVTSEDVKDRIESERRLFYVACTRAKKKLIIATDIDRRSSLVLEALHHRGSVEVPVVEVNSFVERKLEEVEADVQLEREKQEAIRQLRERERQERINKRNRGLADLESLLGNTVDETEVDNTMSLGNIDDILGTGE